jgi:cell division GTPase FtsZ
LETTIEGATGVIVNISGGVDLTMGEVQHAVTLIHEVVDDKANIIFGADIREDLEEEVQVTIIATGFDKGNFETFVEDQRKKNDIKPKSLYGAESMSSILLQDKKDEQSKIQLQQKPAYENRPQPYNPQQPYATQPQYKEQQQDDPFNPRLQQKDDSNIPPFLRKLRK